MSVYYHFLSLNSIQKKQKVSTVKEGEKKDTLRNLISWRIFNQCEKNEPKEKGDKQKYLIARKNYVGEEKRSWKKRHWEPGEWNLFDLCALRDVTE